MSRIGKKSVSVPGGVTAAVNGQEVKIKGPKGELKHVLADAMVAKLDKDKIAIEMREDTKEARAMWGMSRTLVANLIAGVTQGFSKRLEITGVGYRAALNGKKLQLNLGYSHPIEIDPPDGISFEVENPTRLAVVGIDKELVGQIAAQVRATRKPEPYKGKGVRYAGEYIRRKAGKAGKIGGKK
jgi:large subunit ribosomal protein L6